jgi:hypothetical protein
MGWFGEAGFASPLVGNQISVGLIMSKLYFSMSVLPHGHRAGFMYLVHSADPTSLSSSESDSAELMCAPFFWYQLPLES